MFKISDVNIKSIGEAEKEFSKIVKHVNETGEPTFVLDHNKPEVVILSHEVYEKMVNRVERGPKKLLTADEAFGETLKDNPFDELTDEELFD